MAVQTFTISSTFRGKFRKKLAWSILTDYSGLAQNVEAIDRIDILHRTPEEGRSQWYVTLEGAPFRWIQREFFKSATHELVFKSIDGDFESFKGCWKISDVSGEGIRLECELAFDLGIPVIEMALGDELLKRMKAMAERMVDTIKTRMQACVSEERNLPRIPVNSYTSLTLDGTSARVHVINASRRGMMLSDLQSSQSASMLGVAGRQIEGTLHADGCGPRSSRFVFRTELPHPELEKIVSDLKNSETRDHARELMECRAELTFVDRMIPLTIVNVSPGGMLVRWESLEKSVSDPFEVCGIIVTPRRISEGSQPGTARIEFDRPLTDLEYQTLIARLRKGLDDTDMLVCETIVGSGNATMSVKKYGHLRLITTSR